MRGFPFKHLPAEGAPRKSLHAATKSDSSAERGVRSRVSAANYPMFPLFPAALRRQDSRLAASAANNAGDPAHGRLLGPWPGLDRGGQTRRRRDPPPSDTHFRRRRGGTGGNWAMEALAVLMQDVLGLNHALRRDKGALMEQVRRLLCKKADLLSQACPPACPVAFPETFRVCEGCCRPPWAIWAT